MNKYQELVLSSFPTEAERVAAVAIIEDINGLSRFLGTEPGVIAYALKEIGQERLDRITTKSEMACLVVDFLVEEEDQERAKQVFAEMDAKYDAPPPADFRLFTKLDEVLATMYAAEEAAGHTLH